MPFAHSVPPSASAHLGPVLRVATYNIHKGVRGVGPQKRLEIHNLGLGIQALNADLVFLQEVRHFHHQEAQQFQRTWFGWPNVGQAEFLAPEGFEVAYRTNAVTKHGEHGNALLSRWPMGDVGHHDVSDHRFEQRGLLHVPVNWQGQELHTVVAHLGLMHSGRVRQVQRLAEFVARHVPPEAMLVVAGDFNDWGERLDAPMRELGLTRARHPDGRLRLATFPSRIPFFSLDRIYVRGLRCVNMQVPKGPAWARMSDHLPLLAELAPEGP
ncbi:endonuclease/exonuclease/phosphatase family protein [Paucibacter sp. hw1]|uniref:Endonuclease/exonuclease/phosphatase family protein n=2 Tax=Roseateles koreensis TaxID=2987526 RepID=A0ABT5KW65_9BURK|nr:endonuclease/exonuclease/phosphatase family protein [Roseateles koreensis]MDC8786665.1 endonuclease/exonuclease/phosphatase family protein [Roseateles koreensis]